MVRCCIVYNLTIKLMPTIWVDDRIKAKLIELRFKFHMQATRPHPARYAMRITTRALHEGKY